ncbi:MAG TPA: hypothetical protein VKE40_06575 [Gemmataceae bacterium]|nr:hypothetical protein [Gemmataceae bacterium]
MNRVTTTAVVCLSVYSLAVPEACRADDDASAKELKRLEGVWAAAPPLAIVASGLSG